MKDGKIFDPGCKRCQTTAEMVQAEADRLGIAIALERVTDFAVIAGWGIAATPRHRGRRQGRPCRRSAEERGHRRLAHVIRVDLDDPRPHPSSPTSISATIEAR